MFPINENLSNTDINKIFLDKSSSYTANAITFYTDGSKLNKDAPTGPSVHSPDFNLNVIHRLPAESSVFSAEAWAIYLAINKITDLKAVIFSDSKSVLEALASLLFPNKNYLIHYIKKSWLNCTLKDTELYIFWIPAHKGILGNKIADPLPKKASIQGFKPNFKIPFSGLYSEIKKSLENHLFLDHLLLT